MSFDILVQDIPADAQRLEDIPADFEPRHIGTRVAVVEKIRKSAPEVEFAAPDWGTIDANDYSIEINVPLDDPLMGFSFHVRGSERGLFVVADILDKLGLRAFAPGTDSGFFQLDRAREGTYAREHTATVSRIHDRSGKRLALRN